MIIALTGFMGCGKSTVGRMLQTVLQGYGFIDLDEYIENRCGRAIPEIFSTDGEAVFRKMEADCLEEIVKQDGLNAVLALGGGAVMTGRCFQLIKERTRCIYLRASSETIRKHLTGSHGLEEAAKGRPMLMGNGIEELMARRAPSYESVASHIIDIDGRGPQDIANEIFYLIQRF